MGIRYDLEGLNCPGIYSSSPSICSEELGSSSAQSFFRMHEAPSIMLGWRADLRSRIAEIYHERRKHGWDGYDADPIRQDALNSAFTLVALLPEEVNKPDIVPESNGRISFEWQGEPGNIVSVEVGNNKLVYASVIDAEIKRHGQEPFCNRFPSEVLSLLKSRFTPGSMDQQENL